MYDYAGEWLYRVGLPAKSGVSGGVAAALPGQLGLGVHSPLLDPRGNSVRGVVAAERISRTLGLHLLLPSERTRSGIRRSYRDDTVRSRRGRTRAHSDLLDAEGSAIAVVELTGDQGFASAELLVRLVLDDRTPTSWRILDLRRVTRVDTAAATLLDGLVRQLVESGVAVAIVEPRADTARAAVKHVPAQRFGDPDAALEWAETALLASRGLLDELPEGLVTLAQQDLLQGLGPDVVAEIESRTTTQVFHAGTVLFEEGAEADGLYFIGAGQVSADIRTRSGPRRRLSTIAAGSSFGGSRSSTASPAPPASAPSSRPSASSSPRRPTPRWRRAGAGRLCGATRAIARSLSQRLRYSTADVAAFEET